MSWLYDSHIHLSDQEYKSDILHIINAIEILKLKACCVSMDHQTSVDTLNLSKKSQNILPFIGVHPEMAQKDALSVFEMIEQKNKEISGVGEIGLDRKYITSEEEWNVQKKVFSNQLALAEKFKKPVSIHSRKTLGDVLEIISSFIKILIFCKKLYRREICSTYTPSSMEPLFWMYIVNDGCRQIIYRKRYCLIAV